MSNGGNNDNEGFYNPEAFAIAAWGLLTITIEKLKELDPTLIKGQSSSSIICLLELSRELTPNTRPLNEKRVKYLNRSCAAIWPRTESLGGDL